MNERQGNRDGERDWEFWRNHRCENMRHREEYFESRSNTWSAVQTFIQHVSGRNECNREQHEDEPKSFS